jgi:translation initiation factor 2B subunit (eIF-2B alpha/beta/delta family)
MDERSVVTCFLEAQGRILVVRRSARVSTYQGRWSGISGTVDAGHTPEEQAWQEIREETGLAPPRVWLVSRGQPLSFVDDEISRRWTVYPFRVGVADPAAVRLDWENQEGRWITPSDLGAFETVPHLRDAWERVAAARTAWPDEIGEALRELRDDRERGARELAGHALATLAQAAAVTPAGSVAELRTRLEELAEELATTRPTMAPIAYWTGRFGAALAGLAGEDLPAFRQAAAGAARALQAEAQEAGEHIAAAAAWLLRPGCRVATASYSSLVVAALLAGPRPLEVTVLASVGPQGRSAGRDVVDRLAAHGLGATQVEDAQAQRAGREADVVLIGADAVWPDGSVVNGVPSRALAAAAHEAGRPVYALAERAKVLARPSDPEEPGFEVVPADLLTAIIDEQSAGLPPLSAAPGAQSR